MGNFDIHKGQMKKSNKQWTRILRTDNMTNNIPCKYSIRTYRKIYISKNKINNQFINEQIQNQHDTFLYKTRHRKHTVYKNKTFTGTDKQQQNTVSKPA